jgi:C1A family cysteine protease
MSKSNQWYGWIPDLPDKRDLIFKATRVRVPDNVDLRTTNLFPPVYDQGDIGSCTANAIAAAFSFALNKECSKVLLPSRLFIYYNERAMEGTITSDSGAMIRDGVKSLVNQGVCPEKQWTYSSGPTKFKKKPSAKCFTEAEKHQLLTYKRVSGVTGIQQALASGFPVVVGFTVYDSFESDEVAKTGVVPIPGVGEAVMGGHAVLVVGYDKKAKRFIVRNSWGNDWGDKGYCYMSFEIPFSDCWMMSVVEQ